MSAEWKRLQQLFDDAIRALHARHTHARACSGCVRCRVVDEAAKKALADYDDALHGRDIAPINETTRTIA